MRLVIGGQIDKELVKSIVEREHNGFFSSIKIMGDIEAAMAVKNGDADYYFGACNTGGGGALAMAIALLGADKCFTASMPSNVLSDDKIIEGVQSGKIAFGFTPQTAELVLKTLVSAIKEHCK